MKNKNSKTPFILFAILLVVAVLAAAAFYASRFLPKNSGDNNEEQPAANTINVAEKKISEETDIWSINVVYPETGLDYIDNEALRTVNIEMDSFKEAVSGYPPVGGEAGFKNTLDINYSYGQALNRFFSVIFSVSYYTGGAHNNLNFDALNFDLQEKRKLIFSNLFDPGSDYLKRISEIAINDLKSRQDSELSFIDEGAGPDENNFKSFFITDTSLIFYFPPYQVAPYAAGEQKVEIPFAEIKGILNPSLFGSVIGESGGEQGFSLSSPKANTTVSSPLAIAGRISGSGWAVFEGQGGRVDLLSSNGDLLASSSLKITSGADLPADFSVILTFSVPENNKSGSLVFYNENPSGKPANEKRFVLPIKFN
ncbi:MAG: DUF3298 domain-containing protein [Candidatus Pacebacteria bacterium]|nr:DUF3298 domain-containing protein [Candidatus Paceibacterota bacterium]